ncbi:MAG: DtxR family transcriptional regulator [Melioribacter sp.]|nr:DtxR family transcriptional regulator [Melioribacter sp.]
MSTIIIILSLLIVFIFFLYKNKAFYLMKKNVKEKEKIEDSLKYLYDCEYNQRPCTIKSLSKKLSISFIETTQLINKLVELGLVTEKSDELFLTAEGRQNALQIIRIHRLLEKYFAENTSIVESRWHKLAEIKEHQLNVEEANQIASNLGNPLIDPHGDPIPSVDGTILLENTIKLTELNEGLTAEIIHIEDEPEEIFSLINSLKLYPGMQLKVKSIDKENVLIEIEGRIISLKKDVADNINVKEIKNEILIKNFNRTLSSLKAGESAIVVGLSKALRGQQRRRLLDLGIVPGTKIKAVLESIGKDPVAYEVRGTLIALRKNQSDYIFIQ